MKTIISVYELRGLMRQYDNEEITLSRFTEIINQAASKALDLPHVGGSDSDKFRTITMQTKTKEELKKGKYI
jgi:hypothetical protein